MSVWKSDETLRLMFDILLLRWVDYNIFLHMVLHCACFACESSAIIGTCNNNNIQIQPGLKAKLLLAGIYNLNQTIVNLYSTNQLTLEHIHVTFEGKAKLFQRKIICKQSKLRVKLILHRLDSLICTPKKQHSHNGS